MLIASDKKRENVEHENEVVHANLEKEIVTVEPEFHAEVGASGPSTEYLGQDQLPGVLIGVAAQSIQDDKEHQHADEAHMTRHGNIPHRLVGKRRRLERLRAGCYCVIHLRLFPL